jgi:hypothetical protein
VEVGLSNIYRQGRRRHRRAARSKGDRAVAFHLWRKRVKDLRYAAEALDRLEPARGHQTRQKPAGKRLRKQRAARTEANAIRRTARRADELGELLGEEHDLVLLATRLDREAEGSGGGRSGENADRGSEHGQLGDAEYRILLKLIARRRRRMRSHALSQGERLYRRRPKVFVARTRAAYERSARR